MTEGMGMLRKGDALAEENGPMLGRGIGLSGDRERATSNLVGAGQQVQPASQPQASPEGHAGHAMAKPGDPMEMYPKDDPEKKKVPGYPQDMWMPMDDMFGKPENYGLRKGWSGAMMGMMTLVRVVTEEVYDKITDLQQAESKKPREMKQDEHKNMQHKK